MSMFYNIPKDEIRAGRFELDGVVWVPERTCRMETDELFPVGHAVCSACGKYVSVGNYCPNCGARITGVS